MWRKSGAAVKAFTLGLLMCAATAVGGCAGTIAAANATHRVGHAPEHLMETAVGVGEAMYTEYDYLSLGWAVVQVKNDFHWSIPGASVFIPAGELLTNAGSGAYCTAVDRYSSLGFRRKVCFGDGNHDMRFEKMQIEGTIVGYSVEVPYEAGAAGEHELIQAGFRQELVYEGVAGGVIKLLYREYKDDFARPAFFQDVNYDYEPGMTISFKGARFEIRDANREQISFSVLSGFRRE